ncbi:MAG: bifunctional oligoribonuclease/PAP phosphatase NrnA [Phycisphaerales bacterium]|nr:MAG: bifunctional oligoribonuclease/PAP phosphatase NrnA [Phycisphaerales bacterium]
MVAKDRFQEAVDLINSSGSVLVTTHAKPDGDACGCVAVLCDALRALGKTPQPLMLSPIPQWYQFLFDEKVPVLGEDIAAEQLKEGSLGEFDLTILVDVDSATQLAKFNEYLEQSGKPVLVIDHHVTADGLGDVQVKDPGAAGTGLIVLELLKYAGWPITEKMAEALFVAVATDTGWFQFDNTDHRVYESCAELVDIGAKPPDIHSKLYQNFSHERFKLMVTMLNSLELHLEGRYATQHILQRDFQLSGAKFEDTENLIDECRRIGTVKVSCLFVELKDGRVKCSLRSRGAVDVSAVAQKFGGGGHKMAAGAQLTGPLENAKQLVFEQIAAQLSESSRT